MKLLFQSPPAVLSAVVGAAFSVYVAAIMIQLSDPTDFKWLLFIPFWLWCVAPIAIPLFYRSWVNLIGVAAIAVWGVWEYDQQLFGPGARSTSPLAFIFVPIYQWMAVFVLFAINWLVSRIGPKS